MPESANHSFQVRTAFKPPYFYKACNGSTSMIYSHCTNKTFWIFQPCMLHISRCFHSPPAECSSYICVHADYRHSYKAAICIMQSDESNRTILYLATLHKIAPVEFGIDIKYVCFLSSRNFLAVSSDGVKCFIVSLDAIATPMHGTDAKLKLHEAVYRISGIYGRFGYLLVEMKDKQDCDNNAFVVVSEDLFTVYDLQSSICDAQCFLLENREVILNVAWGGLLDNERALCIATSSRILVFTIGYSNDCNHKLNLIYQCKYTGSRNVFDVGVTTSIIWFKRAYHVCELFISSFFINPTLSRYACVLSLNAQYRSWNILAITKHVLICTCVEKRKLCVVFQASFPIYLFSSARICQICSRCHLATIHCECIPEF